MSLALDGRLPEGDLKQAREALAHAKAVGEEYEGVTVSTFTVRARSAGEAIVREARRRGVEAIVMSAAEPSHVRGGVLLGRSEEHTSELQSRHYLACRLLLEKKTTSPL